MRHLTAALACVVAALSASFSPAAFAQRETAVEAGLRTQTLHLGNGAEPADLDPQISTVYTDYNILLSLFEGLTVIDEATSQALPGAAERWDISPDGLTYTFHLRANGRWSNGDPVTAQEFVTSFQRILSPALGAEYAYMLHAVKNAEAFSTAKITDFSQVGFRAIDARTLEISLERPTPYLLTLVAHQAWFPIHPPTILKFGKLDQRGTRWTQPGNLVGNGAYTLKVWQPNARIIVEKSDTYWDAPDTKLRSIVFYPNENIATDERNFRSGQLHITYDILPEKIPGYRKQSPSPLRVDPLLETLYIRFNTTKPPFDNKKVRQALARALDREIICRVLLSGSREPAHFFTPPNTAGYTATARVPSDFEAARKLLAEAGYPGGKGFPTVELQMNTDGINKKIFEAVQEMWRRELGITVRLTSQDFRVYLDAQRTLSYQISRSRWVGDYNDPNTYLDMFVTGGANNQTGWSNAEYDRLIAEAGRTLDQAARFDLFQKAEAILLDEAPIAPLLFGTRTYLIHPSVKGWVPSLLGIHRYQNISLE
ncbi:ABC transporter substrate-binding protein [Nibricoccus aquaticus]|uniref:ABC transporter substrate-binding protein n=1 Tax=Nibricoccus aquaticus TaxID=2576891 RepID=A0A290QD45_9BACT|nr:peptide ABC transporter substrate-binding protein [Nibricoccus aquaticus]ATC63258.1 ABC transporter substrate-binding protein [Nibricoccus aquaticus]